MVGNCCQVDTYTERSDSIISWVWVEWTCTMMTLYPRPNSAMTIGQPLGEETALLHVKTMKTTFTLKLFACEVILTANKTLAHIIISPPALNPVSYKYYTDWHIIYIHKHTTTHPPCHTHCVCPRQTPCRRDC